MALCELTWGPDKSPGGHGGGAGALGAIPAGDWLSCALQQGPDWTRAAFGSLGRRWGCRASPKCRRPLGFSLGGWAPVASSLAFPQPGAADSHPRPGPHPSRLSHTGLTGLPGPPGPSLPGAVLPPLLSPSPRSSGAEGQPPARGVPNWTHRDRKGLGEGHGTRWGTVSGVGQGQQAALPAHKALLAAAQSAHPWAHKRPGAFLLAGSRLCLSEAPRAVEYVLLEEPVLLKVVRVLPSGGGPGGGSLSARMHGPFGAP